MFECEVTIRTWSKEETKENETSTRVNLYKTNITLETSSLDRDDMILVALMSDDDDVKITMTRSWWH